MKNLKISILDILEDTVRRFPDKIALKDENNSVSFKELLELSKKGATYILNKYNKKNSPIAVEVDRDLKTIVMFFSVLYSGNFYVPIDSETPKNRLEHIFNTLDPLCALGISQDSKVFKHTAKEKFFFDEITSEKVDSQLLDSARKKLIDIDPAYVLFTSGSTGKPKGVTINHRMVIDLSNWLCERFGFSEKDIIGNQTPFYFDASVKDIYIMANSGATLNIISRKYFTSPIRLIEYLNNEKVTTILWAVSAINIVANSGVLNQTMPKYVNKVFFAGEALHAKQLNIWMDKVNKARYINLYGPTEATVDAIYYIIDRKIADNESIPIGKACENMEVFLVDENNKEIRDDVGEIVIRGTGVAMGYYNDKIRSDQVFIQDPRQDFFRDIVYKTGDLGKYNDRGEIVFVSRKDNQIKNLGNRIELGEIEQVLNSHSNIQDGICIYDDIKQNIVYIYTGEELTKKEMFIYLLDKLPKYMIPNQIIKIEKMPYTQNGKINRLELTSEYKNGNL